MEMTASGISGDASTSNAAELKALETKLTAEHQSQMQTAIEAARVEALKNPLSIPEVKAELESAVERGRQEAGMKLKLKDATLVKTQARLKALEAQLEAAGLTPWSLLKQRPSFHLPQLHPLGPPALHRPQLHLLAPRPQQRLFREALPRFLPAPNLLLQMYEAEALRVAVEDKPLEEEELRHPFQLTLLQMLPLRRLHQQHRLWPRQLRRVYPFWEPLQQLNALVMETQLGTILSLSD
jgi:hypothetical protein